MPMPALVFLMPMPPKYPWWKNKTRYGRENKANIANSWSVAMGENVIIPGKSLIYMYKQTCNYGSILKQTEGQYRTRKNRQRYSYMCRLCGSRIEEVLGWSKFALMYQLKQEHPWNFVHSLPFAWPEKCALVRALSEADRGTLILVTLRYPGPPYFNF